MTNGPTSSTAAPPPASPIGGSSPFGELGAWLGSIRARSLLAPAGALATLAIVAAIGVGVTSDDRGGDDAGTTAVLDSGGTTLEKQSTVPAAAGDTDASADDAGLAGGLPSAVPEEALDANGEFMPLSADKANERALRYSAPSLDSLENADAGAANLNRQVAPGTEKRLQDRSAYLRLKTDTNEVREVNDEAIQITESVGGVVESANLSETAKTASASLELSIPTRELDGTLDRLTDLATVASLDEASEDITKPFVSAEDNLADAQAEREQLLQALAEADTETEAEAIRAQLDDVRDEISQAEAVFDNIARKARMASVSLQIEGTVGGDATDDGSWGLGDAADDALSALKTVAGVMLVGAAIVLPVVALIALLVWLTMVARRRNREKALDD